MELSIAKDALQREAASYLKSLGEKEAVISAMAVELDAVKRTNASAEAQIDELDAKLAELRVEKIFEPPDVTKATAARRTSGPEEEKGRGRGDQAAAPYPGPRPNRRRRVRRRDIAEREAEAEAEAVAVAATPVVVRLSTLLRRRRCGQAGRGGVGQGRGVHLAKHLHDRCRTMGVHRADDPLAPDLRGAETGAPGDALRAARSPGGEHGRGRAYRHGRGGGVRGHQEAHDGPARAMGQGGALARPREQENGACMGAAPAGA